MDGTAAVRASVASHRRLRHEAGVCAQPEPTNDNFVSQQNRFNSCGRSTTKQMRLTEDENVDGGVAEVRTSVYVSIHLSVAQGELEPFLDRWVHLSRACVV